MANPMDGIMDSVDQMNRQLRALSTPALEAEDVNRINAAVVNAFLDAGVKLLEGLTAAATEAKTRVSAKLEATPEYPTKEPVKKVPVT